MPYRPLFEASETTVFQERQNKAQLQCSRVAEGKNCEAQNFNFWVKFCALLSHSYRMYIEHAPFVWTPKAGPECKNFAPKNNELLDSQWVSLMRREMTVTMVIATKDDCRSTYYLLGHGVLTIHGLWILFVARSSKIVALSRLMCLLRSVYLPGPKTKTFRP